MTRQLPLTLRPERSYLLINLLFAFAYLFLSFSMGSFMLNDIFYANPRADIFELLFLTGVAISLPFMFLCAIYFILVQMFSDAYHLKVTHEGVHFTSNFRRHFMRWENCKRIHLIKHQFARSYGFEVPFEAAPPSRIRPFRSTWFHIAANYEGITNEELLTLFQDLHNRAKEERPHGGGSPSLVDERFGYSAKVE